MMKLSDRTMNIVLWVLQVLLALAFLAHGLMLLFPPASLIAMMNATIGPAFRLFLGVAEVLADGSRRHANPAMAGSGCRCRPDDCDDWGGHSSHLTRGGVFGDHYGDLARTVDVRRLHALEGSADSASYNHRLIGEGSDADRH
jgi:hypothetical protein